MDAISRMRGANAPPRCPPGLAAALVERDAEVERFEVNPPRAWLFASSPSERLFGWFSTDPEDEQTVLREVAVREAVGTDGPLRAPAVLAYGPQWRLEPALDKHPILEDGRIGALSEAVIDELVAAASVLQNSDLPQVGTPPRTRETLAARWWRRCRQLRSPLSMRDAVAARRIMSDHSLPPVTCHGDFRFAHVFPADGGLWVIDWEHVGKRPAGWDLIWLSLDLDRREDRDWLFDVATEIVGARYHDALRRLRYAAIVRRLSPMLLAPNPHYRDSERVPLLLDELERVRTEAAPA